VQRIDYKMNWLNYKGIKQMSYEIKETNVSKYYKNIDVSYMTKIEEINNVSGLINNVKCFTSPIVDFDIINNNSIVITKVNITGLPTIMAADSSLSSLNYLNNLIQIITNREAYSFTYKKIDWKENMKDEEVARILKDNLPFMLISFGSREYTKEIFSQTLNRTYSESQVSYMIGVIDKQLLGVGNALKATVFAIFNYFFYRHFIHNTYKDNIITYLLSSNIIPGSKHKSELLYSVYHQSDKFPGNSKLFYSGKTEKTIVSADHLDCSLTDPDQIYIKGNVDRERAVYITKGSVETNQANIYTKMFHITMQDFANTLCRPISLINFNIKENN